MAASNAPTIAVLAIACLLISMPLSESLITCGQVASSLGPCINYIRGAGPLVPGCCAGVRSLKSAAATTADRQTACNCLKGFNGKISGLKLNLVSGLPGECGVNVGYPISTSVDCSRVK